MSGLLRVTVSDAVATGTIAVLVALPEEAAPVRERLRAGCEGRGERLELARGGRTWRHHSGWLGEQRAALIETGPGPKRATRVAGEVLDSIRPAAIICAGLAGALRADLERGHVIAAARVVDSVSGEVFEADAGLLDAARRLPRVSRFHEVTLLTHDRIVGTASEKASLAHRAHAVDMESAAVARVAAARGVPFLALRVISDTAEEDFPIDLNHYIDGQGNLRRMRLAATAVARPSTVPFLLRMRAAAQEGSATLARCLESLMSFWPEAKPVGGAAP